MLILHQIPVTATFSARCQKRKTFGFRLRVGARVGGGNLDPGNKIPLWAPIQNARDMRSANKS